MSIVKKELWIPSDGIVLEKNADDAVKSERNVLVVAGPGAGKTELLAQKANFLFETGLCKYPHRILAISFKKDAAKNLKDRIVKRCGREAASRFDSMTYDAFAKSILDHFRLALPCELRPDSEYIVNDRGILAKAFQKYSFIDKYKFDKILSSVSIPFNENGIGEKVWQILVKGTEEYKSMLTFDMISMLAEYIVRTNSMIKAGLHESYKFVFLDEFQDTTNLQYALVKQCFFDANTVITAVGDNKQRIMVWAGARKTVFDDFKSDWDAIKYNLLMNHRSAPRLVDLQRKMYNSLNESDGIVHHSEKWNENDGDINLIISEDTRSETITIVDSILNKIASGTQPKEMCIICKQKPENYTSEIIDELNKHKIYARIETDYQDLIKEPIVELLLAFLSLACDRKQPENWQFVVSELSELWNISSDQSNEEYYITLSKIEKELLNVERKIDDKIDQAEIWLVFKELISFFGIKHIKTKYAEYGQGNYLKETVKKFLKFFWNELTKSNYDLLEAIENFKGLHSIPIMTIHKSKGLEYEMVYFVGLEDSAFWSFKNQPEEDRCAFFVALSRAKREITFTFCKNRHLKMQKHDDINEFFELLKEPGVATIIEC